MEKKLQVKNLRISFRTSNGKVQAVRDINFDLAKGETLAIVGESGSGKSVTSKAILGIQAGNAINESGEIIYDGQDLLKISEEEFHKIRGDKIAMIFQDPMSSLNPIVRIGKQLTEAMILKGKARQRESKSNFNGYLKNLKEAMVAAADGADAKALQDKCAKFDKFEYQHTILEAAYNKAHVACGEALEEIEGVAFEMEKKSGKDLSFRVKDVANRAAESVNPYVVSDKAERIAELAKALPQLYAAGKKSQEFEETLKNIYEIRDILTEANAKKAPNFFRMGYYTTFVSKELPAMDVEALDAHMLEKLMEGFMNEFLKDAKKALVYTAEASYKNMEEAVKALREGTEAFTQEKLNKKAAYGTAKELSKKAFSTLDKLARSRDSLTYTFPSSIKSELDTYFGAIKKNAKAEKVHAKEQKVYDKLVAKGKTPDYEVAAAAVIDLELVKQNIVRIINRLADHYEELLAARGSRDFDAETVEAIDYLKANASGVVDKVTKRIAKDRAIKLMDEVGIAEPHKRFNQYPFEFSGGMRQRIS